MPKHKVLLRKKVRILLLSKDVKDVSAIIEDQVIINPSMQRHSFSWPTNLDFIKVEESMPRRRLEEEIILGIEDELEQQSPTFVKTLLNSSPHYDRLKTTHSAC